MNTFFITISLICICFLSYAWFLFCTKKTNPNIHCMKLAKQPITAFIILGFIGCSLCYFFLPDYQDTLYPISFLSVCCIFISASLITGLSQIIKSEKIRFLTILILCSLNIFILPSDFSSSTISPLAEKAIFILIWTLFAFLYNNLNNCDGVLNLQSLSISIGLILMSTIGILPILYAYFSGTLCALLIAFNFFATYPAKITLNSSSARCLGFIIGWLCVLATIEGNGSCVIILCMYYIYELTIALLKKLTFKSQFKKLENNTFYSNLAAKGIAPHNIFELISRINLMLLLLAGFQIYSPNTYTIPLISFLMVFWITHQIISPNDNNKNHLLLTTSLLSSLKKSYKETKNLINKDK